MKEIRPVQLRDLQVLQRHFDESRGFNFEGKATKESLLQFSVLALCGEVGELANKIKKDVRAKMLDSTGTAGEDAAGELGDILAYLLKVANLLDEDLSVRYLRQMCENTLRFASQPSNKKSVVVLAGPSGAGKSTAVALLLERLPSLARYLEETEGNHYLYEALGAGGHSAVFKSQQWFLESQRKFVETTVDQSLVLMEQDPVAIVLIYAEKFFAEQKLQREEYAFLLQELLQLSMAMGSVRSSRLTIVLDAPGEVLHRRVSARSRVVPPKSWFEDVRSRFLALYSGKPNCVIVDTSLKSPAQIATGLWNRIEEWRVVGQCAKS
jgi:deoxyadenosine/deoxycytidine kinase/NTP pyrophosphatase (non-canonical NTP hydrolase)